MSQDPPYGHTVRLPGVSFDEARGRITDALKQEGFGVLTEIDVKATLKAKLNVDFRRYVILGACNPHLAHKALSADLGIGLLLPCNVCVWEDEGGSVVSVIRPDAMFSVVKTELLVVLDGAKGLRAAVREVFGDVPGVHVQRCQWHKRENVVSYLAKGVSLTAVENGKVWSSTEDCVASDVLQAGFQSM